MKSGGGLSGPPSFSFLPIPWGGGPRSGGGGDANVSRLAAPSVSSPAASIHLPIATRQGGKERAAHPMRRPFSLKEQKPSPSRGEGWVGVEAGRLKARA